MLKGIVRLYFKRKTKEYFKILKIEFVKLSVMLILTIYWNYMIKKLMWVVLILIFLTERR